MFTAFGESGPTSTQLRLILELLASRRDITWDSSDDNESDSEEDEVFDSSDDDDAVALFESDADFLAFLRSIVPPRKVVKDVPCKFFLMGRCRAGDSCEYSHDVTPPSTPTSLGTTPLTAPVTTREADTRNPSSRPPCKFFAQGWCMKGDHCMFAHGSSVPATAPTEEDGGGDCSICYENVRQSSKLFGLLPGCDHVFCIDCIRTWRDQAKQDDDTPYSPAPTTSTLRVCPMCRTPSHFVIPSKVWPRDTKHKREIQTAYVEKLKKIPCKYKYQVGMCPFGAHCFYKH